MIDNKAIAIQTTNIQAICKFSEICTYKDCYHRNIHGYMTAICREQFCSLMGILSKCELRL